jgi:hypothetical protein
MQWEMSHNTAGHQLLNGEEFHGEEAYTGEFVNPIAQNFVFVKFSML